MSASSPPSVPLSGISIRSFEAAVLIGHTGLRIYDDSGAAIGFLKILKSYGNVPTTGGAVTCVVAADSALGPHARIIKAAVWDNVKVLDGAEAGRVGKITEFIPGSHGDGSDDRYIVKSIVEGKFDSRLLADPTLGWDAAMWPANFLSAKADDKAWQKDNQQPEYIWPTLTSAEHAITLELNAAQFERYTKYLTTDDLCKLVVLPRTLNSVVAGLGGGGSTTTSTSTSYCDVLHAQWVQSDGAEGEEMCDATQFVSHAWKYDIATVVETLRAWVDSDASPADAEATSRFWFDNFVLDEHAAAAGKYSSKFWFDGFSEAIKAMGHTLPILMPWRSAIPLTRAWCVYEIAETARVGALSTFLLPPREKENMIATLADDIHTLSAAISGVALENAEGGADDRSQIMQLAHAHGINKLNGMVCSAMREWLVVEATARLLHFDTGGPDMIKKGNHFCMEIGRLHQELGHPMLSGKYFQRYNDTIRVAAVPGTRTHAEIMLLEGDEREAAGIFEAEMGLRRAIEMFDANEHIDPMCEAVLSCVMELVKMLRRAKKPEEALEFAQRVVEGSDATHGNKHEISIRRLKVLVELLDECGVESDDGAIYQERLDIADAASEARAAAAAAAASSKGLKPTPWLIFTVTGGMCMYNMGMIEDHIQGIETGYAQIAKARDEAATPEVAKNFDASCLSTSNTLAEMYVPLGRDAEAEVLYRDILRHHTEINGPRGKETVAAQQQFVGVLQRNGKTSEAREHAARAFEALEIVLGFECGETLCAAVNLSAMMLLDGSAAEAETLLRRCLDATGGGTPRGVLVGEKGGDIKLRMARGCIVSNLILVLDALPRRGNEARELEAEDNESPESEESWRMMSGFPAVAQRAAQPGRSAQQEDG